MCGALSEEGDIAHLIEAVEYRRQPGQPVHGLLDALATALHFPRGYSGIREPRQADAFLEYLRQPLQLMTELCQERRIGFRGCK